MTDYKPPPGLKPRWLADEHRLADLDAALGRYTEAGMIPPSEWLKERRDLVRSLLQHRPTDAAMAQPEPVAPTDEELLRIAANEVGYEFSSRWFMTGANSPYIETNPTELLNLARAVLVRWGHPTLTPIPVSERPWEREGWRDAGGRCWWHAPETDTRCAVWCLGFGPVPKETHCLPFHAMPLPAAPGEGE